MHKRKPRSRYQFLTFTGPSFGGRRMWPIIRTMSPAPFVKLASLRNGQGAAYREAVR